MEGSVVGSVSTRLIGSVGELHSTREYYLHYPAPLGGFTVEYRVEDFLQADPSLLRGKDLAVLNEVLGDFPMALGIPSESLDGRETSRCELSKRVLDLFERYLLQKPEATSFGLNFGALEALEKPCASGVPHIFLCEHSCEAETPADLEGLLRITSAGRPERIPLKGHDEYTIQFTHLTAVAGTWGYDIRRGPLAHFREIPPKLPRWVFPFLRFGIPSKRP